MFVVSSGFSARTSAFRSRGHPYQIQMHPFKHRKYVVMLLAAGLHQVFGFLQ